MSDVDMGSDIEDKQDNLPDDRAWGQRRKNFYNTDYVDADYSGYNDAEEAEAAQQEEEEARNIQKRLMEQLTDADFSLEDILESAQTEGKETIERELSSMTRRQRLEYFQKESPEFENLVNDFQVNMEEAKKLLPVLGLIENGTLVNWQGENFVKIRYRMILGYCAYILFYLVMKAKRMPLRDHPALSAIANKRLLLQGLQKISDRFAPEIEGIFQDVVNKPEESLKKKKILTLLRKQPKIQEKQETVLEEKPLVEEPEEVGIMEDSTSQSKRAITYEMAKNKGLTPKRKKEQRNPRVKHRNKFKKALVRRRGQVRTARKEIPVYAGEPSGIKIGLKKGRKFK